MIRSWYLENFKSAGEPTSLALAPLTVFAGPNSSGKSTIIQSILLTAQTLQSAVVDRPVILNGHMARLGSFSDIVTGADEAATVTIGFSLSLHPERMYRPARGGVWREGGGYWWLPHAGPIGVEARYSFSMRGPPEEVEALRLQPRLERSVLHVHDLGESEQQPVGIRLERIEEETVDRLKEFGINPKHVDSSLTPLLRFKVRELSAEAEAFHSQGPLENASIAGVALRHFLPIYVALAFDAVETEVRRVVDSLTAKGTLSWRELDDQVASIMDQTAVRSVVEAVLNEFEEKNLDDLESTRTHRMPRSVLNRVRELLDRVREPGVRLQEVMVHLPPTLRAEIAELFGDREQALANAVRRGRQPRIELTARALPDKLASAVAATGRFFTTSVHYLGPLRDEPKAVYPLAGGADPSDVGFRGEHTAAVLEVHRNTEVDTIDPAYFEHDVTSSPRVAKRPVLDATLAWLEYMGVGTSLTTVDRGKLGHELKVAVGREGPQHDLTQVGVGVSQVLPILVLSLLADHGSTVIFEQPELHLHPRVQTRLADFFVALTMMGKQCIVETHSEYLINQLRYRAVVSGGDEVAASLGLYFVEKQGGQSTYRPVRINSYGVIEDWPSGFFDEKERTAARIMKAAMDKRHRVEER